MKLFFFVYVSKIYFFFWRCFLLFCTRHTGMLQEKKIHTENLEYTSCELVPIRYAVYTKQAAAPIVQKSKIQKPQKTKLLLQSIHDPKPTLRSFGLIQQQILTRDISLSFSSLSVTLHSIVLITSSSVMLIEIFATLTTKLQIFISSLRL